MPTSVVLPDLEQVELPTDAVEVGRIRDAWGLMGGFKVVPYSASPEALFSARQWFVQPPEQGRKAFRGTRLLRVREVKAHGDALIVSAHDVPDRTVAETLKNARLFVPRSSFPRLAENEYYWIDLIGLEVINREGVALGQVRSILATGPQEVLVLAYQEAGEQHDRLIPFVSAYIDSVDVPARRIVADWQTDY